MYVWCFVYETFLKYWGMEHANKWSHSIACQLHKWMSLLLLPSYDCLFSFCPYPYILSAFLFSIFICHFVCCCPLESLVYCKFIVGLWCLRNYGRRVTGHARCFWYITSACYWEAARWRRAGWCHATCRSRFSFSLLLTCCVTPWFLVVTRNGGTHPIPMITCAWRLRLCIAVAVVMYLYCIVVITSFC